MSINDAGLNHRHSPKWAVWTKFWRCDAGSSPCRRRELAVWSGICRRDVGLHHLRPPELDVWLRGEPEESAHI